MGQKSICPKLHRYQEIGRAIGLKSAYHTVVVKSTVTPGTTVNLVKEILEKESLTQWKGLWPRHEPKFCVRFCLIRFLAPDRIVLGGDKRAVDDLARLYEVFGKVDIVKTDYYCGDDKVLF